MVLSRPVAAEQLSGAGSAQAGRCSPLPGARTTPEPTHEQSREHGNASRTSGPNALLAQ